MNDWQHALTTHGSWIDIGHSSYVVAAANQYVAAASWLIKPKKSSDAAKNTSLAYFFSKH
jgi:hypothetical protein